MEGAPLKAARDLDTQMERLDQNWRGALTRIGGATVPWATDMVTAFNNLWDAVSGNRTDTITEIDRKMSELQRNIEQTAKHRAELIEQQRTGTPDFSTRRADMIERETRAIAANIKAIEDLARQRRALAGISDADRLKSIHGTGAPAGEKDRLAAALAEADAAAKSAAAAKKRAESLQELQRQLGISRDRAVALQQAIERLDDTLAKEKLVEKIRQATGENLAAATGVPTIPTFPKIQMPAVDQPVEFDAKAHNERLKELLETMPRARAEMVLVAEQWKQSLQEMTSAQAIFNDAANATLSALNTGFYQVMSNWRQQALLSRESILTMLRAIEQEAIAFLARMAALKVVEFIFGVPISAAAGATSGSTGPGQGRFPGFTQSQSRTRQSARPMVVNVTINGVLGAESVATAMTSPRGVLRRAIEDASRGADSNG